MTDTIQAIIANMRATAEHERNVADDCTTEYVADQLDAFADRLSALSARASAGEGGHVGNEWADMAANGVQWLRNIRDGISTADEALAEMESNARRITALAAAPQPAQAGASGGVRIKTKGPDDFASHVCPAESSAVWNACVYEHERITEGLPPILSSTEVTPASPATGDWFADALTATGEAVPLDAELPGMWERADLIGGATDVAPQPQEAPAQHHGPEDSRPCYVCGQRADAHQMVPGPRGGMKRGECPATPPAHGDGEDDLRARIEELEDELQEAIETVADGYERDCGVALRGLMKLIGHEWDEPLAAWQQADAIAEHIHELTKATRPTPEAQEARDEYADLVCDLILLLPGAYYMDTPDGGDVTVLEQLKRMSKDAARYLWLRDCANEARRSDPACVSHPLDYQQMTILHGEELDAAIDAALALPAQGEGKNA